MRFALAAVAVGFYIGLGFLIRPDANTYLLLGMPITVAFQLAIARRPLRELWLRRGQASRFDRWSWMLLLIFLVGPVVIMWLGVEGTSLPIIVYGAASMLGAVGAAQAYRVLDAKYLRQLAVLLVVSVAIGLARLLLLSVTEGSTVEPQLPMRLLLWLRSLLFYVPAMFVAEEVFFRGALDSYLHRGHHEADWGSAAFVSLLWGLWHLPIVGPLSLGVVLQILAAQLVLGLILSWTWRQSGNLAVPGTIHAIIDALRNAVLA
jgi:membrane protease YdiL (CAAX protease family)